MVSGGAGAPLEEMRANYATPGFGYGHAKQAAFEAYWEYFRTFRERREELAADPGYVDQILARGTEQARDIASGTMARVRKAVGLR